VHAELGGLMHEAVAGPVDRRTQRWAD